MRCSLDDPEDLKYQKLAHDSQSPNSGQRLLNIHDAIQNVDIVVKEGAADKGFRANRNSILGQQLASNSSVAARVKARHTMQQGIQSASRLGAGRDAPSSNGRYINSDIILCLEDMNGKQSQPKRQGGMLNNSNSMPSFETVAVKKSKKRVG